MKSDCSVFKYFPYRPRYYLRHPFEWIGDKWRALKWAKQRAIRGYADCDIWNMDSWFSSVVPEMLEQLAEEANGWPDGKFETFGEWQQWLRDTAAAIKMMREEEQDAINPYWPAYQEELGNWQYTEKGYAPSELSHKYQAEASRIAEAMQEKFEQAMISFSKNFHCLWD